MDWINFDNNLFADDPGPAMETSPVQLRRYQLDAIEEVFRLIAAGERRILVVSPTGSGKTVIIAEIIRRLKAQHQKVLFLDHRREITTQTVDKLRVVGVTPGVIQRGFPRSPLNPVQVASIQSLSSWLNRASMELPDADVICIDEAHHTPARSYRNLLKQYPDAILVGLTATPCRADGRGLGGDYDVMVECPDVPELIAHDPPYLVPCRVYSSPPPDLKGVRTTAGDFNRQQLASRVDTPKLVADVVSTWFKHAEGRPTIVYATSVGHSVHLRDRFIEAGITCEHVDGKTPIDEREEALARFRSGAVKIICNCGVFTEGTDLPDTGCIVLARPTKSLGLYRQMVGRGFRPAPGKTHVIILDHGDHIHRLGMPDDRMEWELHADRLAARNTDQAKREAAGTRIVECSQCGTLREGGKPCPCCGFLPRPKPNIVIPREGELVEINAAPDWDAAAESVRQRDWHFMLAGYAEEQGYKPGWVAHKFKEKFGRWPPPRPVTPIDPSPEVRSWIRSRNIAWAKAQEKERAG